jgi:hypothetical protein
MTFGVFVYSIVCCEIEKMINYASGRKEKIWEKRLKPETCGASSAHVVESLPRREKESAFILSYFLALFFRRLPHPLPLLLFDWRYLFAPSVSLSRTLGALSKHTLREREGAGSKTSITSSFFSCNSIFSKV